MPAITSIVAKIMIFVDALLEKFVTVSTAEVPSSQSNCLVNFISGGMTDCGTELINELETLIFYLLKVGGDLLPALGPLVGV